MMSRQEKVKQIEECLSQSEVNIWQLREFCLTGGGLINNDIRQRTWYKLVGIDPNQSVLSDDCPSTGTVDSIADILDDTDDDDDDDDHDDDHHDKVPILETSFSEDTELISRDVGRAVYFRYKSLQETKKNNESLNFGDSGKNILTKIIVSTVSNNANGQGQGGGRRLNYYQGFHDVASVIFVTMPQKPELASKILQRIALSHLRDAMKKDFTYSSALLETTFFPLLQVFDEELHDFLILRELEPTVFLTWMITLFAHDIHDSEVASRLFDAILAFHPLLPLYLTLAILIHPKNRQKLFEAKNKEVGMLQVVATRLLSGLMNDFDTSHQDGFSAQEVIDVALGFMKRIPPESLLSLAKQYDLGQCKIVMKRSELLCLFNLPQSSAIVQPNIDSINEKEKMNLVDDNEKTIPTVFLPTKEYPNALIAAGISS
mmetsp:Transcript_19084/g.23486  ORF Transcript_19084/g.23486 Transcript_19084/m.23486 type:complete len:431 (-) Transcript_19084:211-1503(-)